MTGIEKPSFEIARYQKAFFHNYKASKSLLYLLSLNLSGRCKWRRTFQVRKFPPQANYKNSL